MLNKAENPRTMTAVQIILLNYQLNINLIEITNTTGSATRSRLRNGGKLGTTKATEKRRIRDPREIWIASLATNFEGKFIMMGKVTAQLKPR